MLAEYKQTYAQYANSVDGWRKMSSMELCNKYIEYENINPTIANAYLSAIIYKYWNMVDVYYHKNFGHLDAEDSYDWLISTVLYVLKHRVWLDPNHKLYNDPTAIDKAIHIRMYSTYLNHQKAVRTQKRDWDNGVYSWEMLKENIGDGVYAYNDGELATPFQYDYMSDFVVDCFNKKEYLKAFIIDGIVNEDVFMNKDGEEVFAIHRLLHHLRNLDEVFIKIFSDRYNLSCTSVAKACTYIPNTDKALLRRKVKHELFILKKDTLRAQRRGEVCF